MGSYNEFLNSTSTKDSTIKKVNDRLKSRDDLRITMQEAMERFYHDKARCQRAEKVSRRGTKKQKRNVDPKSM